jgi:NAD(P)H dehydrogenase (quinone)
VTPGDGKVAWVDRGELREGTARIIASPSSKYANQTELLTGSSAVSLTDVAKIVNKVTGKDLPIRRGTVKDWVEAAVAAGQDKFFAETFAETFAGVVRGELETLTPDLEVLLGRRPKSIEEVVRETLSK